MTKNEMSKHLILRDNLDKNFIELAELLQLDSASDFRGCILRNLDLKHLDLKGFDFSGADLRGCIWDGSRISNATFDNKTRYDRLAILKTQDYAQNEFFNQPLVQRFIEDREELISLLARTLRVSWLPRGYVGETNLVAETRLFEFLAANWGEGDDNVLEPEHVRAEIRDKVTEWRLALSDGSLAAASECIRHIQYFSVSQYKERNRFLRLLTVIMRLEFHRIRNNLSFGSTENDLSFNSDQIESVLDLVGPTDLEIMQSILAEAVPRSDATELRVGLLFASKVLSSGGQARIEVSGLKRHFHLESNFTSLAWFHEPPRKGTLGMVVTRRNSEITQRGGQFVEAVIELLFPVSLDREHPTTVYMGASNSWAVVVTSGKKQSFLLADKGKMVRQIQAACGLRRVTVTKASEDPEIEIRHFINDGFADIQDIEIKPDFVWGRLRNPQPLIDFVSAGRPVYEDNKVRTFVAMWRKVFPKFKIIVSMGNNQSFSSDGFSKFKDKRGNTSDPARS